MTRVGRPVDKVYSEFLQEGSKYAQIRSLQEIFDEFIHQRDNYANRGLKLGMILSMQLLYGNLLLIRIGV